MLRRLSAEEEEELATMAGPNFQRRRSFGIRDRSIRFLGDERADSLRALRFKDALARRLVNEWPKDRIVNGLFQSTGLNGEWDRIRNLSGYPMNPAGSPTGNKIPEVPDKFSSSGDEELFRWLTRTLTRHVVPAGFAVRRDSSSGHPWYSRDIDVKYAALINGSALFRTQRGRQLVRGARLREMARYGIYFAHTKAARSQADSARAGKEPNTWMFKPREVFDWQGRRVQADKSLDLHGALRHAAGRFAEQLPRHGRVRERTAFSVGAAINEAHQTAAAGVRAGLFQTFPRTYHFRDPETQEREQDPTKPHAVTLDVRNFDQYQGLFMIQAFIDELPLIEEAKQTLRWLVTAPVFVSADVIGERGGHWLGNPLDPASFTAHHGNPSGWVWNDILNAVVGTFVALLALRAIGIWRQEGDWQGVVLTILSWRHSEVGINNKGDDTVLWMRDRHARNRLEAKLREPGRPLYFEVEVEEAAQFLGSVFVQEHGRTRLWPNLTSFLVNVLVPEYEAGSAQRPYASFGYFKKHAYYGRHPLFRAIDAVVEEESLRHLGVRLSDLAKASLVIPPRSEDLESYAAITFYLNPAAIHYKVQPSELPPGLYERFFFAIPADDAWPQFGLPMLEPGAFETLDPIEPQHEQRRTL